MRNSQERNNRLENLCWRIWNVARQKKQVRSALFRPPCAMDGDAVRGRSTRAYMAFTCPAFPSVRHRVSLLLQTEKTNLVFNVGGLLSLAHRALRTLPFNCRRVYSNLLGWVTFSLVSSFTVGLPLAHGSIHGREGVSTAFWLYPSLYLSGEKWE